MNIYTNPPQQDWAKIIARPAMDTSQMQAIISPILDNVKNNGDKALVDYASKFDNVIIDSLSVSITEIDEAEQLLSSGLKTAIQQAYNNIYKFHSSQLQPAEKIETMPGVVCWRKSVGINKVGIYIPGGTAPLFSTVLMLAIPADIAGCEQIILCTPPQANGKVHPAVLYAASISGVHTIIKAGGAQAIAALAFGTESVPKVYKIFGPGNQYVTAAKQMVQQFGTAIDMPAGPSEVCVLADESSNPTYIAADLLSQAEHGNDSQVLLVATSQEIISNVQLQLTEQLATLPRAAFAGNALSNSNAIVLSNLEQAIALVNEYAPEHLILATENAEELSTKIVNAGSIFLGHYTPESVGDYASGTNHTLPTNGYARAYSGVSVDSFVKKITVQQLTHQGLQNIAHTVIAMAEAEGLQAHANAVKVRL
ncbi:histidinol dehydrogenase [Polluticaenibacter yanchengensis]|uniref:Histidinol dehydrogenase n=1 Tax=Polluticaenibacter yanchengensis TaxID=3014562 RepID=A0ABT4UNM0_9BACT|nr:histidinol dehydrogenase [Chitinophagaceae bacterium LY-5]